MKNNNDISINNRLNFYLKETKEYIRKNTNIYGYKYLVRQLENDKLLYWLDITDIENNWIITLQQKFSELYKIIKEKNNYVNIFSNKLIDKDNYLDDLYIRDIITKINFIDFLAYIDLWILEILKIRYNIINLLNNEQKKVYMLIIWNDNEIINLNKEKIKEKWRKILSSK